MTNNSSNSSDNQSDLDSRATSDMTHKSDTITTEKEEKHNPSKHNKPVLGNIDGVVQLVRDQPPEHCIVKIDAFSKLQDAVPKTREKDHVNSVEFKAGGYTWVLSVYPEGNKQEDGEGHLSLYVVLVDKLDSRTFVYASVRFFIYDQIRDNYVTFLDIGDKRFHALKTEWGIPKLVALDSFADASNGFLVKDSCVFGTEILIRNGPTQRTVVSHLGSTSEGSYTWKIENFSKLRDPLYSPVFSSDKWSWKLKLCPKGDPQMKGEYIMVYLALDNAKELTRGQKLYAECCISIKNHDNEEADHKITTGHQWFHSAVIGWGHVKVLSISDIYDISKGFLENDTLIVEAEVENLILLKDMDL